MSAEASLLLALLLAALGAFYFYSRRVQTQLDRLQGQVAQQRLREDFLDAVLRAEASEENFSRLIGDYLPRFFPGQQIVGWRFLEEVLWTSEESPELPLAELSAWLLGHTGIEFIERGDALPWSEGEVSGQDSLFASLAPEAGQSPIAGLAVLIIEEEAGASAQGMIQLEADLRFCQEQLAGFLGRMQRGEQEEALQSIQQELAIASQIQADLLPRDYPEMPGWQLAFSLHSAGDLSGDFFDLIPLGGTQIGFLIADVAGKGLGAALYMTLCRTLMRSFAKEYVRRPDLVVAETNARLLEDARDALFVTGFYGVLDYETNELVYANAGHNPPFLLSAKGEAKAKALPLTGLPIGIDVDESWGLEQIQVEAGDFLFLYTDGIPDSTNAERETFGDERLLEELVAQRGEPANVIQEKVLEAIEAFTEGEPQFDDVTLLILQREA